MNIHIIPHNLSKVSQMRFRPVLLLCLVIIILVPIFLHRRFYKPREETLRLREEVNAIIPVIGNIKEDYLYVKRRVEENEARSQEIIELANYRVEVPQKDAYLSSQDLKELRTAVTRQNRLQENIAEELGADESVLMYIPSIAPSHGRLIRGFGFGYDPFTGETRFCRGIDILANVGEEIYATAHGVVRFAGWRRHQGYTVEITHKRGIVTRYTHLSRIKTRRGKRVERGDVIGLVGKSGKTEGPRLRYEVWKDGNPVDPLIFILERMETL